MSEQNKILGRHSLQDTLGADRLLGPQIDASVSNLHSRLVAATDEMGKLRSDSETQGEPDKNPEAGMGEPKHRLRRKDEPELGSHPPEAVVTLDDLHNMVQEIRDHLGWDRPFAERGATPSVLAEHERNRAKMVTARLEADVEKAYGRSVMEDEIPGQLKRNKELAARLDDLRQPEDNWQHRAQHMRCQTCMWYVPKRPEQIDGKYSTDQFVGRCRHNAPTMKGWPVMFPTDWCGDHKLDETKL